MKTGFSIPNPLRLPFSLGRLAFLMAIACWAGLQAGAQVTVSNLWSISTDAGRSYVTSTNNQERGIAYNPVTGHVLLVSRSGGLQVPILDGDTGTELGFLNVSGIAGGFFTLSLIGVAEDGAIYGGNLVTTAANPMYRLYRWADETAAPALVFSGNPGGTAAGRWGDTFDVRGSGTNTQVLLGSQSNMVSILQATSDAMTDFAAVPLIVSGSLSGDFTYGVAFGAGNVFYAKKFGSTTLREVAFDLVAGTASVVANHSIDANVVAISVWTNNTLLAGVKTATTATGHQVNIYDLYDGGALPLIGTVAFPAPAFGNPNVAGSSDIGPNGRLCAVDTQNGVVAAQLIVSTNPSAPVVVANPGNVRIVQGGYGSMSASATGTRPIAVQWLLNGAPIPNATNRILLLTNLTLAQAGNYKARFSNIAGTTDSAEGVLRVTPSVFSDILTPLWQLLPGDRPYIGLDGTQRGIAAHPVTGNLLLVSRTGSNAVYVLDGETGAELHTMNLSGVSGGTYAINLIGISGDGVVYVGNLTTSSASTPFKLYSWIDDNADVVPVAAWSGDPGAGLTPRWGDAMAVRGASLDGSTEVLLASRNSNIVAIIRPDFGASGAAITITVADAPGGAFGLGVAFGPGNTFWGKATDQALRLVEYDPMAGTGGTLYTFTNYPAMASLGSDLANQLMAGISLENPDNLRLFDTASLSHGLNNIDTEIFNTDNANANGTGAITFGNRRLYALDSNNGLRAYVLNPDCLPTSLEITRAGNEVSLSWNRAGLRLQGTGSLANPASATVWTDIAGGSPASVSSASGHRFFRLICP